MMLVIRAWVEKPEAGAMWLSLVLDGNWTNCEVEAAGIFVPLDERCMELVE